MRRKIVLYLFVVLLVAGCAPTNPEKPVIEEETPKEPFVYEIQSNPVERLRMIPGWNNDTSYFPFRNIYALSVLRINGDNIDVCNFIINEYSRYKSLYEPEIISYNFEKDMVRYEETEYYFADETVTIPEECREFRKMVLHLLIPQLDGHEEADLARCAEMLTDYSYQYYPKIRPLTNDIKQILTSGSGVLELKFEEIEKNVLVAYDRSYFYSPGEYDVYRYDFNQMIFQVTYSKEYEATIKAETYDLANDTLEMDGCVYDFNTKKFDITAPCIDYLEGTESNWVDERGNILYHVTARSYPVGIYIPYEKKKITDITREQFIEYINENYR